MDKGLIHVYCGDGKGKTTAAAGLSIRAAGCGMKVVFLQFLKSMESGEVEVLRNIDNITVIRNEKDYGFFNRMTEEDKHAITELHNDNLKIALGLVDDGQCDLLVLDEACAAYNHNLLDRTLVEELIKNKKDALELVLTGRDPDPLFTEYADYVSEIRKIKHPYDKKIIARKGIEY